MIGIITTAVIIAFLILIIIFLISALPLYFAVKLLNGKTTLFKTAIVTLISGIIVSIINFLFRTWGALIAFIVLIWIYHEVFRLKWYKAALVWLIHLAFIVVFNFIFGLIAAILGITFRSIFWF
ncbi:MAG: hypothetical protein PHV16_04765 [Candidatus Nanoarchaeia archaeon]|nr:hypothetical protein [Candidatus Nanoarchaeia archaeon]